MPVYLYRLVVRSSGFQPEDAGSIPARDTIILLSTNGRSSDFQSENAGSIPARSTNPYGLAVRSSGFQPEVASSILARDTRILLLSSNGEDTSLSRM